jgi:Tfp pilus assembly protein PilO
MKLGVSARQQRTLLLGGMLAVLIWWMYTSYLIKPLMREVASVGQQVRSARERLRVLEAAVARETALREQHRQLNQTVTSLRGQLPAEEELPAVIEHLSDLASQAQVKIQTIFPRRSSKSQGADGGPRPTAPGAVVYKDILIEIDALAGYHQLGTFLSFVESGDKPMQVSTLRISGDSKDSKRHRIKLLLRSYFSIGGGLPVGKIPMTQAPGKQTVLARQ